MFERNERFTSVTRDLRGDTQKELVTPGAGILWKDAVTRFEGHYSNQITEKWIRPLRMIAEIDGHMVVCAKDRFTADRVNAEYARSIAKYWGAVDPKGRKLEIKTWSALPKSVRDMVDDPWKKHPSDSEDAPAELSKAHFTTQMRFDTLIIGPSNQRAVGLAKRLAEGDPVPAKVIVIYGAPGTGKTHLMKAVQNSVTERSDTRKVTYLSAEEFMTRFVEGARAGDTRKLQNFVRQNELLLIDDLHWIAGKAKTDKAFFAALRAVTSDGGRVVITADAAPGDITGLSRQLTSELRGAAAVEVGLPCMQMRREIVTRRIEQIASSTPRFTLSDTMIKQIITSIDGAGRELCGALYTLQLETGYGEIAPTQDMLDSVIRRIGGDQCPPSLDDIKRACMDVFDIKRGDIESTSKVRSVCYPRQIAMYLCREMTEKSYPQIAASFKKKDHTTVLHAFRKITQRLGQNDKDLTEDITRVKTVIRDRANRNAVKT